MVVLLSCVRSASTVNAVWVVVVGGAVVMATVLACGSCRAVKVLIPCSEQITDQYIMSTFHFVLCLFFSFSFFLLNI